MVSLFVTPENGVLIQDSFPMNVIYNKLIGVEVPHFYFMKKVCSLIHLKNKEIILMTV